MGKYELTFIFKPELTEKQTDAIIDKLDVEVTGRQQWGKRLLAYAINKLKEGLYVHATISVDPKSLKKLEQTLNLHEDIIRYLLVRAE